MRQGSAAGSAQASRWAIAGLSLTMLMPSLATSSANVALPTLAQLFSASFQATQWIVLSYLLTVTALVAAAGRLGDIFGRRRLLLAGIVIFAVGSLLSGVAPNFGLLIAARAMQGVGAAFMMALTMAFVGAVVPPERTGSAMGLLGTMSAVGTTLGPALGGLLIGWTSGRAIFLVNVPLAVLALALAWRTLPDDSPGTKTAPVRVDFAGMALLGVALTAYALAMTVGRGQFGVLNWAMLAAALATTLIFLAVEARVAAPLIRPELLRDRTLLAGLVTSMIVSAVVMATLIVGPFYLAQVMGLDPARTGLVLAIGPLVAAFVGVPAGRLVDRLGSLRAALGGLVAMAMGTIALSVIPSAWGIAGYVPPIIVVTAGYGVFQAANNTAIMTGSGSAERGVVSGVLNLSRNLGLITGASAMGAVFAWGTGARDVVTAAPSAIAAGMHTAFAVAAGLALVALVVLIRAPRRTPAEASLEAA